MRISALCALFFAPFLLGNIAASHNAFRVNEWMDNSIYLFKTKLQPVRFFKGNEGKVTVDAVHQKKLQQSLSGLQLYDNNMNSRILVAFRLGLAIVDKKTIHFLTEKGVTLSLPSLLPDRSLLYYSEMDDRFHTTNGVLTRAVIRNDTLYKIWERKVPKLHLNHWGDAFENQIYYPGRDFSSLPDTVSQAIGYKYATCKQNNAVHDTIRVLDADTGKLKKNIPLLPIIASFKDGNEAMVKNISNCTDPLHTNDIQIIKDDRTAHFFPQGKVGDMLISMRNISTILLLDGDTLQVKWHVTNKTVQQHSPRITDWGTLLVFDNLSSDKQNGRSRITEISIDSGNVLGYWEATGNDYFESYYRGKVTIFKNRIIVQSQDSHSRNNSMFVLDCPGHPISMACKKTTIFTGKPPNFRYDNAVLLDSSSGSLSSS